MLLAIKICESSGVLNAIYIIKMITRIILILVPIIIIVTSIVNVVKAVISDDSKIKDAVYLMFTKIIIGAIIFMIPIITNAIISLVDSGKVSNSYLSCYKNATAEKIKEYKAKEEAEMKAEAEAKDKERKANAQKYENQQSETDKNNNIVSNNLSNGNDSNNNNSSGNGSSGTGNYNNNGSSETTNNLGNNASFGNNTSSGTSSYGSSLTITSGAFEKKYNNVNYYEVIPPNPKRNMPLVIFLHGSGENGNLSRVKNLPIVKKVAAGNFYGSGEYIFIAPASPSGSWYEKSNLNSVMSLINHVADEYSIDKDRIYINGFSAGAIATWLLVNNNPSFFAAAVPVSYCENGAKASNFTKTPIWAIAGSKESYVTCMNNFVNSINSNGGIAKMTVLSGKDHSGTQSTYPTQELFTWMLSKKK